MEGTPQAPRAFSIEGFVIIIAVIVFSVVLLLPIIGWQERKPYKAICQNNLMHIFAATRYYVSAYGADQGYPPHVGKRFLLCLAGRCDDKHQHPDAYFSKPPLIASGNELNCLLSKNEGIFASYLGPKKHSPEGNTSALLNGLPTDTPIAADQKGNHSDGGYVLFFDGRIKYLQGEEYEKALQQLE